MDDKKRRVIRKMREKDKTGKRKRNMGWQDDSWKVERDLGEEKPGWKEEKKCRNVRRWKKGRRKVSQGKKEWSGRLLKELKMDGRVGN